MTPPPHRVLIVSAGIGAGHDRPAEMLARQLREERPGTEVAIVDGLAEMGAFVVSVIEDNSRILFERPGMHWAFDVQYWLCLVFPPTRWLMRAISAIFGGRTLRRLAAEHRATVVVSTYPGTTDVLGTLRRLDRMKAPTVAAITDLAALRYWSHPDVDLHLVIHPESRAEIERVSGPVRVEAVRGFSGPEFHAPVDPAAARAALGLPAQGPIVIVSGGGWAVGDLEGAIDEALAQGAFVVCLCGSQAAVRERIARRFAGSRRVRAEGFTERMCEFLTAADALVHSTAGLTVLEARMRGCRPISYGWGVAHIRANNRAYARYGLADVAASRAELSAALAGALASPLPPDTAPGGFPSAASLVLELADASSGA